MTTFKQHMYQLEAAITKPSHFDTAFNYAAASPAYVAAVNAMEQVVEFLGKAANNG